MKICKICNSEIKEKKRWVYCSEKCELVGKNIANNIKNNKQSQDHKKQKENWKHETIFLNKAKHEKLVPINQLGLSNAASTYLKNMLKQNDLTIKKVLKFKRIDNFTKSYTVVVVSTKMIKILFDKKYELYKKNFRIDTLRTVKYLVKAYDIVNEYDFKKAKNAK